MATNKSERCFECESKRITALLLIEAYIHCYRHFNNTPANVRLFSSQLTAYGNFLLYFRSGSFTVKALTFLLFPH